MQRKNVLVNVDRSLIDFARSNPITEEDMEKADDELPGEYPSQGRGLFSTLAVVGLVGVLSVIAIRVL